MAIYYLIWIICLIVVALPCHSNKSYKIQLAICFGLLFLFGAFRLNFGNDYEMYERIFDKYAKQSAFHYNTRSHEEIGYAFLNFISPTYRFLIIVTSLFVCYSYYVFFSKYIPAKYRFISIFFFFLLGNFTVFFMFVGVRNSLTIGLLLLSIPLIKNHKLWQFSLILIFASLFHTSALIAYPIAYLMGYLTKINNKSFYWIVGIIIVIGLIPFNYLLLFSDIFVSKYFDRYEFYQNFANKLNIGASILVKFSNILLIIGTLLIVKNKKLNRTSILLCMLGCLSFFFYLLGPLNQRMSIYFVIFTIPAIITVYRNIRNKIIGLGVLLFFTAYYSYSFFVVFLNDVNFNHNSFKNLLLL